MENKMIIVKEEDFGSSFNWFKEENMKEQKSYTLDDAEYRWIGSLDVNLKIKNALRKALKVIVKVVTKAGQIIMNLGRIVIRIAKQFLALFPNATTSLCLCVLLNLMVASIPIIGTVFSPLVTLVTAALGLAGIGVDILSRLMELIGADNWQKANNFFKEKVYL